MIQKAHDELRENEQLKLLDTKGDERKETGNSTVHQIYATTK
jgi:hypothetical protein